MPNSLRTQLASLLVVALLLAAPAALEAQASGIPIGAKPAPAEVRTLDGKPVNLSQWVGKGPVLLEFWATWCGNCEELEPAIVAAARKYAGKVRFVGVAVSVNQSPARVKRYAERHQLPLEIVYDHDGQAGEAYSVPATSYVVVLDASGTVVYTGLGGDQDIEAAIRKAL